MKLLFDQNLSFRLCVRLADLFPDSNQVRRLGLDQADDRAIWRYAKDIGYAEDATSACLEIYQRG